MRCEPIDQRWRDETVIVAASGPSLTPETADMVLASGLACIAVNDAYRLLPGADLLYGADLAWWESNDTLSLDFRGERWSSHSTNQGFCDDKREAADTYRLRLVAAVAGEGFSTDARHINYGEQSHSGFHAANLALLFGASRVILVGFDMRRVEGRAHFFGEHPDGLRRDSDYPGFIGAYTADPRILNATPHSALKCFERIELSAALAAQWREPRPGESRSRIGVSA